MVIDEFWDDDDSCRQVGDYSKDICYALVGEAYVYFNHLCNVLAVVSRAVEHDISTWMNKVAAALWDEFWSDEVGIAPFLTVRIRTGISVEPAPIFPWTCYTGEIFWSSFPCFLGSLGTAVISIGSASLGSVLGEETLGVTRSDLVGADSFVVAFEVVCCSGGTLGESLKVL